METSCVPSHERVTMIDNSVMAKQDKAALDNKIYEMQVKICKAFAHPARLRMLDILGKGERTASELQNELGITAANTSQHLTILRNAGVVSTRKEGKQMYCSIAMPEVRSACSLIRDVLRAQVRSERELKV